MPQWDNPEIAGAFIRSLATGPNQLRDAKTPCPECGEKLAFTENGVVHLDPPRRRVKCIKCEYRGFLNVEQPPQGVDIVESLERGKKKADSDTEDDN